MIPQKHSVMLPWGGVSLSKLFISNCRCGMVKRAPHSSMVAQGWVSKPVNVSRQTWMVGPEYTWYMRCSCIKVGGAAAPAMDCCSDASRRRYADGGAAHVLCALTLPSFSLSLVYLPTPSSFNYVTFLGAVL